MRNVLTYFALTLCLMAGCGATHTLDDRWLPLEEIVERPGNDTWATTIGKRVYVANLERFFAKHPEDSIQLESLLSHELVHSWRQHQKGVNGWLIKYITNREFRLREEAIAYYIDNRIEGRSKEEIVENLLRYRPSMGTEDEIRAVVEETIANPPLKEDLPPQLRHLGR